jgi:hypothetical protein
LGPSQAVPPTVPNHWSALATPREDIHFGTCRHAFPIKILCFTQK